MRTITRREALAALAMLGTLTACGSSESSTSGSDAGSSDSTASAEGTLVTGETQDVEDVVFEGDGIALKAEDGAQVTVTGSVIATATSGASEIRGVISDASEVEVAGDVTVTGEGAEAAGAVVAEYGGTVAVGGDVNVSQGMAIEAFAEGAEVTVIGNVNITSAPEGYRGVMPQTDSTVTIAGDINFEGDGYVGLDMEGSGSVASVGGSIISTAGGVWASAGSEVTISGDVQAGLTGAQMFLSGDAATLVVGGTVHADTYGALVVRTDEDLAHLDDTTIVVGALEVGDDSELVWGVTAPVTFDSWDDDRGNTYEEAYFDGDEQDMTEEQLEAVAQAVNYIVTAENFDVAGTSSVEAAGATYEVAHEGDELTLTPKDGYEVGDDSFAGYEATDNGDGTYTVVVERGGHLFF